MHYTQAILWIAGLISLLWAQEQRILRRRPEIDALFRDAQWVLIEDAPIPRTTPRSLLRTAVLPPLPWLKPSQDADTVPNVPATQPNFAGDTLLGNNAGQDIDPNTSSDCHHSFFDSLYAMGAWAVFSTRQGSPAFFSNYLFPPQNMSPDTLFYIGGGIAERYDINPCALAGTGNSLYIKGAAAHILNNLSYSPRDCDPSGLTEPTGGNGDGTYTIWYEIRDTVEFLLEVEPNDLRQWVYPAETLAQVSKPISDVRIGWFVNAGQCIAHTINRLERLDHAYFPTPVEITRPRSIFVTLKYELYDPTLDGISDTLCGLIGPAYGDNHPCLTGDTNIVGRNYMLTPAYKQSQNQWIFRDDWYPQYFLFSGGGYDLNFLLFPIIYEAPGTSGGVSQADCQTTVLKSGRQGFGLPYPNPAVDCINMYLSSPAATVARFQLLSTDGALVRSWERPVSAGEATVSLDLGSISAGSYILVVETPYGRGGFMINVLR
ncbi:MAG: T9SS type A sorting domain-containing protein [Bacteroidia bacterium]|nr:T9SS type A sorting domain-containing protein [Bacteroidia bacterium]